ncbi:aldo/keto reductase [Hymenobacter sp. GOD-10R]|uniref:aldo/keto reductase n=1 Tax=Hymenobacter sp. GOD-10R TaxID=3093922 RepID=UPI002D77F966|nr:aldo/keto reductase [Hymenobacter sp. GOD-10R]WRQ30691.1 aldo/keto reductase [Hymenobacter sp. GOD-10R]
MNRVVTIGADTASPLLARTPGYGTMRLTGEDFWGEPRDRAEALALLRQAVDLGVNFFDTADFYGPGVTNRLLAEALYPYSADLILATKVGGTRGADKSWQPYAQPAEVRRSVENNLKELRLEQLPLVHFGKAADSPGSYEAAFTTLLEMQQEGKILHLGLSNATLAQFQVARALGPVASVENLYSYAQRVTDPSSSYGFQGGELLPVCEQHRIVFIPFFSLQTSLPTAQQKLQGVAAAKGITVAQLNLAWLLHQSEWIFPIPGTTSLQHLQENIQAAAISLSPEELAFLG